MAQIGIGTSSPNASAALEIKDSTKGLLIPRMTMNQRLAIVSPANGLMVYQTDNIKGFWYYETNQWICSSMPKGSAQGDMLYWNGAQWLVVNAGLPGQYLQMSSSLIPTWVNYREASVSAIDCSSVSFSATSTINVAYAGTATIPYAGGNGVVYTAGTSIPSTGVLGLSATLQSGTLTTGNGNLSYLITGTPTSSGSANFAIAFGGQTCSFSFNVISNSVSTRTVYDSIYGAYSITYDANYVTIKTYDLPNHKSAYWPTTNALYESFAGGITFNNLTFNKAPNSIVTQNITIKIPLNPTVDPNHAATPMGVIGIGLDGVPFFNQYAAGGVALTGEISGFDQYWGHPQVSGMYHYHVEPKYLTTVHAKKYSLMGFLLDGYPVYGPQETDGVLATNLDVYHGHTHAKPEYPSGTYHYHFTQESPYLNGNGFYGVKGTVTQ